MRCQSGGGESRQPPVRHGEICQAQTGRRDGHDARPNAILNRPIMRRKRPFPRKGC
jgi:hypothetical protein